MLAPVARPAPGRAAAWSDCTPGACARARLRRGRWSRKAAMGCSVVCYAVCVPPWRGP